MTSKTESPLAQAAQDLQRYAADSDQDALERCLSACLQPAYRQAYAELGNDADAQDVAQEALLQLTRSAERYDPQYPLGPWLARHVTFACAYLRRSAARRRRREQRVAAERAHLMREQVHTQVAGNHELEHLRSAVAQLKDKDRALISMHYFAEQSQAQVADALGISENAASVRIHRVRGKLKRILEKQGMRAELTLLPALLAAAPLPPAQLLAQTLHCCSAAVLPSTTIPLTIIEKTTMLIQAHPIISLAATILLSVVGISSPLLWAADQAPVVNSSSTVAGAAGAQWNPAAQKLLAFHDPDALMEVASDGPALRQLLLDTKPFNYLKTAAGKQLLLNWDEELQHLVDWSQTNDGKQLSTIVEAWRNQRGFLMQLDNPPVKSILVIDVADHAASKAKSLMRPGDRELISEHDGYTFYGDRLAASKNAIIMSSTPVQIPQQRTPSPDLQQYPLWLRLHPKKLLAALVANQNELQNFSQYLDQGWETRDLQLEARLNNDHDVLELHGSIKGLPTNALYLGATIVGEILGRKSLPIAPLQLHRPQHLPAVSPGALAELRFACDYQSHTELKPVLKKLLQADDLLPALAETWNGELLMAAQPGIPLPQPEVVIGLQGDVSGVVKQLEKMLGSMQAQELAVEAPAKSSDKAIIKSWLLYSAFGTRYVAVSKDRLIVSGNNNIQQLMQSNPAEHALALHIDLPTLAKTYGSLLWARVPAQQPMYFKNNYKFINKLSNIISENRTETRDKREVFDSNKINKDIVTSDEYKNWINSNVSDEDGDTVSKYVSVWSGQGGHASRIVFRTQLGWHIMYTIPLPQNLQAIQQQLKGFVRVAGTPLQDLTNHPRGLVPVFNKSKLLPAYTDMLQLMPDYHLTWDRDADGAQHFVEHGLPLTAVLFGSLGYALTTFDPAREAEKMRIFKIHADLFTKYEKQIKAIRKLNAAMSQVTWKRPSDVLAHAPAETLWALGLGKHPSAQQIDGLGHWLDGVYSHLKMAILVNVDVASLEESQWTGEIKWMFKLEDHCWLAIGPGLVGLSFAENAPKAPPLLDEKPLAPEAQPDADPNF